ncbi:MAG: Gfo/Idh/MocA family oxidoreductase [candidate division KSB1 bacterium]|nr:Gfo/Idh/MocA family oxidoreductase [candidate division KSB1 bacterium]MDZ7366643.1 Gfo/Idh/MocA family oxidoreductase [candidate division KSB1 bacterium]MDZ7404654.1 Gfo/Idh/MocA family oxidoreductase [candidate division KSB1 bacterium]
MSPIRFTVIGLGGFAEAHLNAVDWLEKQGLAKLAGVIAIEYDRRRFPEKIKKLNERGIPLYSSIADFFQHGKNSAEVLTAPIGIHQHVPVSLAALEAGLHVYCEKPVAATIQEVDQLIAAKKKFGKLVAIGYQYIYSQSIQKLKTRICDGRLGAVKNAALVCAWPRSEAYYGRNDWAGRLQKDGQWVLDSPMNNAMAHYLQNLLYLASTSRHEAAAPAEVTAELYRRGQSESCDTTLLRIKCDNGSLLHFYATHNSETMFGPEMKLRCENGVVQWEKFNGETTIFYDDGSAEKFANTDELWMFAGFRHFVQAIRGETRLLCPPEVCRGHTLVVNAAHESCPAIAAFPPELTCLESAPETIPSQQPIGVFHRVRGLDQWLREAYENEKLFSETEKSWAICGKPFRLQNYRHFPQPGGDFARAMQQ